MGFGQSEEMFRTRFVIQVQGRQAPQTGQP
jgi:hypothetical protein